MGVWRDGRGRPNYERGRPASRSRKRTFRIAGQPTAPRRLGHQRDLGGTRKRCVTSPWWFPRFALMIHRRPDDSPRSCRHATRYRGCAAMSSRPARDRISRWSASELIAIRNAPYANR